MLRTFHLLCTMSLFCSCNSTARLSFICKKFSGFYLNDNNNNNSNNNNNDNDNNSNNNNNNNNNNKNN